MPSDESTEESESVGELLPVPTDERSDCNESVDDDESELLPSNA